MNTTLIIMAAGIGSRFGENANEYKYIKKFRTFKII